MKIYLVGGAVRDQLMGRVPQDRDYLVLGATPEDMLEKGFLKVGNDFSVFLHPVTREEYALPRGNSLEDDLWRRDLTINAMAISEEGELIDPFGGKRDLEQKILRHVSDAFGDDPIRVFRAARFCAQFPGFWIAENTLALMKELSHKESFRKLLSERVLGEIEKALQAPAPEKFFAILRPLGAWDYFAPELLKKWDKSIVNLSSASSQLQETPLRFAALCSHLSEEEVIGLTLRWGTPRSWKDIALAMVNFGTKLLSFENLSPEEKLDIFYNLDAFRRPSVLNDTLKALQALHPDYSSHSVLEAFESVTNIGVKNIDHLLQGKEIGSAIRQERLRRLTN